MRIHYQRYNFIISFQKSIRFESYPTFLFRSVLGKELKNLSCIFKKRTCDSCDLKYQCAYSFVFETPIPKDTLFLTGRDHATHPFILGIEKALDTDLKEMTISMTLLGRGLDYFPYLYYALKKGGENGIFNERITYNINDVTIENRSIMKEDGSLNMDISHKVWSVNYDMESGSESQYLIDLESPLRIKKMGNYISHLAFEDLISAVYHKVDVLSALYGSRRTEDCDNCLEKAAKHIEPKEEKSTFSWMDFSRYSARQKTEMKLGGVVGTMEVKGKFTPFEKSLLDAAQIFNAGKNVSFGLGKVNVREGKE